MVRLASLRQRFGRWIAGAPINGAIATTGPISSGDGTATLPGYAGGVDLALQSAAVWSCIRVISQPVGALPAHIFEQTVDGKVKAFRHPYYRMLTVQPNPNMTLTQLVQTTVMNLLVYGNAWWYPYRVNGEVFAVFPLDPERMEIRGEEEDVYYYRYADRQGRSTDFRMGELLHFRMFTLDGVIGLSPLDYHRLNVSFELQSQAYADALFRNGGRPSGVLEYPTQLKTEQAAKIRESWRAIHSGARGAGEVAILDNGTKYTPISMHLSQLEYTAQQKFSVEQIARIYGVPPHLVGAQDKPTYASVEQQSLEFVQYTIQPIVTTLEKTVESILLEPPYIYRFNIAAFQRSDIKTRYAAYSQARQWGWMSVNDIRELEDMNRIGPGGDVYLEPLNMVPAATDAGEPEIAREREA